MPLVVGPHYIFCAHRFAMFTTDHAYQWESKHWYIIYTVAPTNHFLSSCEQFPQDDK